MSRSESKPRLSPSACIAEGAIVRGDVIIGDRASIWFNAVVRGDEGTHKGKGQVCLRLRAASALRRSSSMIDR